MDHVPKKIDRSRLFQFHRGKVECRTEAGLEVGAKTRLHCTIMAVASVFLAMGSIFLSTTSIFLVSASVFSS